MNLKQFKLNILNSVQTHIIFGCPAEENYGGVDEETKAEQKEAMLPPVTAVISLPSTTTAPSSLPPEHKIGPGNDLS